MNDEQVWETEERLWTGGMNFYHSGMADSCIMAFPGPAGIMAGGDIIASLEHAPRWASVAMAERRLARPTPGTIVLGYRAKGRQQDASVYEAFCTSTHCQIGDRWQIVQHQQSPV